MSYLKKAFFCLFFFLAITVHSAHAADSNCSNKWFAWTQSWYAGSSIGSTAGGNTICQNAMGSASWYWVEFHNESQWEADGYILGTIAKPEACTCASGQSAWIWINDQSAECYETGNNLGIVSARYTRTCDNCGTAGWIYFGCGPYSGNCACSEVKPLLCGCTPGDCRVGAGAPCNTGSDCLTGSCSGGICATTMCTPQGNATNVAINTTATAVGYTPDFGSPGLIVNGTFAPEGTSWNNGSYAVRVYDNTRYLQVDLGYVYSIGRVRAQADDNDTYYVTRYTGSQWVLFWQVPYSSGGGLRTRDSGTVANANARYWAIYPVAGDSSYSVSELELYAPGDWTITDTQTCSSTSTGITGKIRIQGAGLLVIQNGYQVLSNDVWVEKSGSQAVNIYSGSLLVQ